MANSASTAIKIDSESTPLRHIVEEAASKARVPARELLVRSLLELPLVATSYGYAEASECRAVVLETAYAMPNIVEWHTIPDCGPMSVSDFHFKETSEDVAASICNRFHYIRSHRTDSLYFGLFRIPRDHMPTTLFVVSKPDKHNTVETSSPIGVSLILSRVFSFPGSPANSISFGLSKLGRTLSEQGGVVLSTAVNRNLGFSGVSYRASGWTKVGTEAFSSYHYIDGRYVTERVAEVAEQTRQTEVVKSRMTLRPKDLFSRAFVRRTN